MAPQTRDPTPDEIREETARIRQGWTESEWHRRLAAEFSRSTGDRYYISSRDIEGLETDV